MSRFDEITEALWRKQARIVERRAELAAVEVAECTFAPQLATTKPRSARACPAARLGAKGGGEGPTVVRPNVAARPL